MPNTDGTDRPVEFLPLEEGDPCPTCGLPLRWDGAERMLYCLNDYDHG